MEKHGQVVRTKPGYADRYIELHKNVWTEVLATIKRSNISNYSIFYRDGWLFSYFEYTGEDYNEDMKKLLADPVMVRWLEVCDPCMLPFDNVPKGVNEVDMEQVFHLE